VSLTKPLTHSPFSQVLNNRYLTEWWLAALFILPWLNPFSPGPSPAVTPWLVTLGCLAFVLLGVARVRLAQVAASAWLAAAMISALLGLLQYFGATAMFGPWVNSTGMGEAFANLRQRNQFATLTNIGLAALLWWMAAPRNWRALFAIAAAVLLAVGNAASSSRTGLVQLALLLVLAWVWSRGGSGWHQPATRRVLLAAALAYAIAAVALPLLAGLDPRAMGILARLHAGDSACGSRLTLWGNVLHLIAQKPWFGWGWSELSYAHFITLYPGERFCDILDNAHNLPLHLAVELGVPLALLICGGGAWLTWRAKPWRESDATRQMAWAVLAVILLHSLLEYPLWYGPFQMAFGLSLWLLWRSPDRVSGKYERFKLLASVLSVLMAMLLIATATYAAWDYYRVSQLYLIPKMRSEAYRDNTLEKVADSWLFRNPVRFAELTTTPLTADNAAHIHALAKAMLHFSPEPRVVQKLIESAVLLGHDDEALYYLARYQAAFPESHAQWAEKLPM
jgi:O-antigen ligase